MLNTTNTANTTLTTTTANTLTHMTPPTTATLVDTTALGPADQARALPALASLLQACVAGGASIGWVSPPGDDEAQAFWRRCLQAAADGQRLMWLALADPADAASVQGTAQLVLDMPANGRHRADIVKVMVHPQARRQGLARALMQQAEAAARTADRSLLVLDTLVGCDAERLYRRLGYQSCGHIPHYARTGLQRVEPTHLMFKRLYPGLDGVHAEPVASPDAQALQQALSQQLAQAYGSSGAAGFAGFQDDDGVFAVARDLAGQAVGCGALRRLPHEGPCSGELKRLYATQPGRGTGSAVLDFLEHEARLLGLRQLLLSTRRANTGACAFYRARGYTEVAPYGPYAGRAESVCLGKTLAP